MVKKEFDEMIKKVKERNLRIFGLNSDCKPQIEDIDFWEKYYNIVFPRSYQEFLLQYGGGYFAYTVVYSFDNQSPFFIPKNVSKEFVNEKKIFPIIDFETGDLGGFSITDGMCEDNIVLYNHEEETFIDTKLNFYDALVKYGLKI